MRKRYHSHIASLTRPMQFRLASDYSSDVETSKKFRRSMNYGCQILWNGNYELETSDRRKFVVLHFEGYYIARSNPADVLKFEEQWYIK